MSSAKITIEIFNSKILIKSSTTDEIYFVEGYNGKFYVTSTNGYDGFEGEGHKTINSAIQSAKRLIKYN